MSHAKLEYQAQKARLYSNTLVDLVFDSRIRSKIKEKDLSSELIEKLSFATDVLEEAMNYILDQAKEEDNNDDNSYTIEYISN